MGTGNSGHVIIWADDTANTTLQETSGWQSKLCLRIIWTCYKTAWLGTDGLDVATSLEISIIRAGTMLMTTEFEHPFVWVHSCFINEFPKNLTVCCRSLRLSKSIRTLVSYLTNTNCLCFGGSSSASSTDMLQLSKASVLSGLDALILTIHWCSHHSCDVLSACLHASAITYQQSRISLR